MDKEVKIEKDEEIEVEVSPEQIKLEKKYAKLIDTKTKQLGNKPIEEWFAAMERLQRQFKKEAERKRIALV